MKRRKRKIVTGACGLTALVVAVLMGLYWQEIAAWYRFIELFEKIGPNEQGLMEYRHRQTGIVMVKIPGGTFMMGSPTAELEALSQTRATMHSRGENWRKKWINDWVVQEIPRHRVTLSPFLIAKYEVTQAQWMEIMGSNPSYFHPGRSKGLLEKPEAQKNLPPDFRSSADDLLRLPVETVTWNECAEFCIRTGLDFSTEAQWEYSCKAGTTGPYAGTGKLEEMGWQGRDCNYPVGLKRPNAFGLHDMHGNVSEWCKDIYNDKFYAEPAASELDPLCDFGSLYRVYRGGGWDLATFHHRSTYRFHGQTAGSRVVQSPPGYIGFRPAYYPLP